MNQLDTENRIKVTQERIDKEVQSSQAYAFNVQNAASVKKLGKPDHIVSACSLINLVSHEDPNGDPEYLELVNTKCQTTASFDPPPGYQSSRWNVCGLNLSGAVGDWEEPLQTIDGLAGNVADEKDKQRTMLEKNFVHIADLNNILQAYRISRAQFLGA